jgi:hypothetical protein
MISIDKTKVIEGLGELADYDFQRRTWLSPAGPEVSSFSELVSQLFDDTGLASVLERNTGSSIFGKSADAALRELNQAVGSVNQRLPPATLLEHPTMQAVRQKAARALAALTR